MIHIASLVLDSLESLNPGVCVREKAAMLMGWETVLIPGQALRILFFPMSEQSHLSHIHCHLPWPCIL